MPIKPMFDEVGLIGDVGYPAIAMWSIRHRDSSIPEI